MSRTKLSWEFTISMTILENLTWIQLYWRNYTNFENLNQNLKVKPKRKQERENFKNKPTLPYLSASLSSPLFIPQTCFCSQPFPKPSLQSPHWWQWWSVTDGSDNGRTKNDDWRRRERITAIEKLKQLGYLSRLSILGSQEKKKNWRKRR